jgi:hypothetical protein
MRVGVLHNPRSHRNRQGIPPVADARIQAFAPATAHELDEAMNKLARSDIDLLVIDGGDGTVRDVLTRALTRFSNLPAVAVVPHGKTNALARDLDTPLHWSVEAAIAAMRSGSPRRTHRPVLQVIRPARPDIVLSGFIFGVGALVQGTQLAQKAHRAGLFNGVAVGASMAAFLASMLIGGRRSSSGGPIGLAFGNQVPESRKRFLVLASTLERLPLRMRPFGKSRAGLKVIDVDAPPRRLLRALPPILSGREPEWLAAAGYRRAQARELRVTGVDRFVLDGEILPADGCIMVREGPLIEFITA